eukprot:GHVO01050762.1.p1 GENE.GHVO01050762.1~~GHVO01050762.1.p1  ORF type:complete len:114 (-),score=4.03 GHVO01050762.1:386-727(-)
MDQLSIRARSTIMMGKMLKMKKKKSPLPKAHLHHLLFDTIKYFFIVVTTVMRLRSISYTTGSLIQNTLSIEIKRETIVPCYTSLLALLDCAIKCIQISPSQEMIVHSYPDDIL